MDSNHPSAQLAAAHAAFERAVGVIGSQVATAQLLGLTQSAISKRLASGKGLWAEHVLVVEYATGIPRGQLRPDIFPDESASGTAALDHAAASEPAREVLP